MLATREPLPHRRRNCTRRVLIGGQSVHLTCGLYPDGRLGEIFIDVNKQGSALRTWVAESAMLFSIALQHGTPLETLVNLFVGSRSDPCGHVEGHSDVVMCTSVMDFVARCVGLEFLGRTDLAVRADT